MIAKPKQPPVWSPTPDAREIGARLQAFRRGRRMSLAALCRATGIDYNTAHAYENGRRVPCVASLVKIASLFETSIDWLLFGWPRRHWEKLKG